MCVLGAGGPGARTWGLWCIGGEELTLGHLGLAGLCCPSVCYLSYSDGLAAGMLWYHLRLVDSSVTLDTLNSCVTTVRAKNQRLSIIPQSFPVPLAPYPSPATPPPSKGAQTYRGSENPTTDKPCPFTTFPGGHILSGSLSLPPVDILAFCLEPSTFISEGPRRPKPHEIHALV